MKVNSFKEISNYMYMKDKNWTVYHEKLYNMLLKYYQKSDNIDENSFLMIKKIFDVNNK